MPINHDAPGFGRKAVIYSTCFVNYNNPQIGAAARAVLARNGVETEVVHPRCCGMPKLEHGDLEAVSENADLVSAELLPWVEKGYDVIALVPSCTLMLKFEWPLLLPDNQAVRRLSEATSDITEYIVDIAKTEGLAEGLEGFDGGIAVHMACHSRAQNIGPKAAEMLRSLPNTKVSVIERCSGHGGSWGMMKENYDTALKVGKPAAKQLVQGGLKAVVSECPLAGVHILQTMEDVVEEEEASRLPETVPHPVELMAKAYGIEV